MDEEQARNEDTIVLLEALVARLRRMRADMPPGGARIEGEGGDAGADALPHQAPAA